MSHRKAMVFTPCLFVQKALIHCAVNTAASDSERRREGSAGPSSMAVLLFIGAMELQVSRSRTIYYLFLRCVREEQFSVIGSRDG
jgi:hypothetical protein